MPSESTPTDPAELNAAFQQALSEYKEEVRSIESLRSEYQSADATRRQAINEELRERHPQSAAVLKRMVDSAVAAYRASPESDPEVAQLLVAVAVHRIGGSGANSQGGTTTKAPSR